MTAMFCVCVLSGSPRRRQDVGRGGVADVVRAARRRPRTHHAHRGVHQKTGDVIVD